MGHDIATSDVDRLIFPIGWEDAFLHNTFSEACQWSTAAVLFSTKWMIWTGPVIIFPTVGLSNLVNVISLHYVMSGINDFINTSHKWSYIQHHHMFYFFGDYVQEIPLRGDTEFGHYFIKYFFFFQWLQNLYLWTLWNVQRWVVQIYEYVSVFVLIVASITE